MPFCGLFLMVLLTQLTAVLRAGYRVYWHNFCSFYLCFNRRTNARRSWLFMSESVTLLVDYLHAEAIEVVKSRVALSASFFELIFVLYYIKLEARILSRSQSINLSTWSEMFLILIWSCMQKTVDIWSESTISETATSDSGYSFAPQYRERHRFPQESIKWNIVMMTFQFHSYCGL